MVSVKDPLTNDVTLRKASPGDLVTMQLFCKKIYPIYFGNHWIDDGLELYLEEQFGTERLTADLSDEGINYYFITYEENNVGFMKVNLAPTNEIIREVSACELEKMYMTAELIGKGIGDKAMSTLIGNMRHIGMKGIFLDVLDTNTSAIRFYKRSGFEFNSESRLEYTYFKDELKGLIIMEYLF